MKIHVLSDLHFELLPPSVDADIAPIRGADLVIIAGDHHRAPLAVRHARQIFPNGPLVMIAGNHEHYGTRMPIAEAIDRMRLDAQIDSELNARATYVLENNAIEIEIAGQAIRIIGCTLWTDFALYHTPEASAAFAADSMNDFAEISGTISWNLRPDEVVTLHAASRTYLETELRKPFRGRTVVVTHHAPSHRSIHKRFLYDPVTPGFASACDDLLALGADLWVHGHTHDSFDYVANGGTRVVYNPRGYSPRKGPQSGVENPAFDKALLVTI